MSQMLDKLARAIAEKRRDRDQQRAGANGFDILLAIDVYLPSAREDARACLQALQSPTDDMVEAGARAIEPSLCETSGHEPGNRSDDRWRREARSLAFDVLTAAISKALED